MVKKSIKIIFISILLILPLYGQKNNENMFKYYFETDQKEISEAEKNVLFCEFIFVNTAVLYSQSYRLFIIPNDFEEGLLGTTEAEIILPHNEDLENPGNLLNLFPLIYNLELEYFSDEAIIISLSGKTLSGPVVVESRLAEEIIFPFDTDPKTENPDYFVNTECRIIKYVEPIEDEIQDTAVMGIF
ncbi:MAG: hypothetical protein ABIA04_04920 [Pseudomonadota bacterium]